MPERLDCYILEGRPGSRSWEVLDPAVAGTDTQLLVPGLIKVCLGTHPRSPPPYGLPGHFPTPPQRGDQLG